MIRYLVPLSLFLAAQTALAAAPSTPEPRAPERSEAAPRSSRSSGSKAPKRSGGSKPSTAKRAPPPQGSQGSSQGSQGSSQGSRGSSQGSQGSQGSRDQGGSQDQNASRPSAGRPEPGRGEVERQPTRPTQSRPVSTNARPASGAPRTATSHRAPPNYRAASGQGRGAPANAHGPGSPPPGGRASATAHSHHQAAAAHHAPGGHRDAAVAHHQAWSHRYRSHHPFRTTLFVSWYPGYPHYWYHGVFVYGPPPGAPADSERAPRRKFEHAGEFALGVRGGTYASGYTNGANYSDFGLGLSARYRIVDPLGVELQWTYHDQSWAEGSDRIDAPLAASVQLFAFPWSRVNPYVLAGVTRTDRNIEDDVGGKIVEQESAVWGPHAGLGLEVGLTDKVSINADIRGIGYLNDPEGDLTQQGAMQSNLGVNFYF